MRISIRFRRPTNRISDAEASGRAGRGGHLSKPELKHVPGFEVLDEIDGFLNGTVCSSPIRREISSASNALSTSWSLRGRDGRRCRYRTGTPCHRPRLVERDGGGERASRFALRSLSGRDRRSSPSSASRSDAYTMASPARRRRWSASNTATSSVAATTASPFSVNTLRQLGGRRGDGGIAVGPVHGRGG
jgi:hypothetical protein